MKQTETLTPAPPPLQPAAVARTRYTSHMPWACESCTFHNPDPKKKCEVCGTAKPAYAPPVVVEPAVKPKAATATATAAPSKTADYDEEGWDDPKPAAGGDAGDDEGWDDDPPAKPADSTATPPVATAAPTAAATAAAATVASNTTATPTKPAAAAATSVRDHKSPAGGDVSSVAGSAVNIHRPYSVLTRAQIAARQRAAIEDVSELLGVSVDEAILLLQAYKWRKQPLQDGWFANKQKVREKVGVREAKVKHTTVDDAFANATAAALAASTSTAAVATAATPAATAGAATAAPTSAADPKAAAAAPAASTKPSEAEQFDCPLCMDTQFVNAHSSLNCGHQFCDECWKNWCTSLFDSKGAASLWMGRCAALKCGEHIYPSHYRHFLPTANKKAAVSEWILLSYVQANDSTLKWCPRAKCDKAVEYRANVLSTANDSKRVECECGHAFCFECSGDDHSPAVCDLVSKWGTKCKSDSENVNWVLANTKICPSCRTPIEKNQGCNHMTCSKCHHEFCWLCKGNWNNHNACNQFDPAEKTSAESAGKALERFQFYFTRYDNHHRAIEFAEKTLAECELKMEQLQRLSGSGVQGVQFLFAGVNEVIHARRLLQWSYVLGFYLIDGTDLKALFELHQKNLETFTESLSAMTEQPLEQLATVPARRTEVINLTRVLKKYRDNIVEFAAQNEPKYKFQKNL